jgi:hypothetical protein
MRDQEVVHLPILLSAEWWRRLQRVAETCYASPREFVREVVEAEIVRRELLMEEEKRADPSWSMAFNTAPVSIKLQ